MKAIPILIASLTGALLLSSCSGPFAQYSDTDLRGEFRKCDFDRLNAAGAQRCLNIQKECEKRKQERGFRC
jgi:hypothetical protein